MDDRASPEEPTPRIAVVLSPHVGRNLFCTPALALVRRRWPGARVRALAGSTRGAAVLEGNPHVDEILVTRTRSGLRRRTRSADLILGLAGRAEAMLGRSAKDPAVHWIPPLPGRAHRADEVLHFVSSVLELAPTQRERRYVVCPGPPELHRAEMLVPRSGRSRVIGIHLGSGRTHAHGWKFWFSGRDADPRLWHVSRYVELACLLTAREAATHFVVTGTRAESFLARSFSSAVRHTTDLTGHTSVLELAAVMTRLDGFVAGDTGPLHLAAAMDVPLVGLFGPTDPSRTGPYPGTRYQRVLRAPSLEHIGPTDVADALERALLQGIVDHRSKLASERRARRP